MCLTSIRRFLDTLINNGKLLAMNAILFIPDSFSNSEQDVQFWAFIHAERD